MVDVRTNRYLEPFIDQDSVKYSTVKSTNWNNCIERSTAVNVESKRFTTDCTHKIRSEKQDSEIS